MTCTGSPSSSLRSARYGPVITCSPPVSPSTISTWVASEIPERTGTLLACPFSTTKTTETGVFAGGLAGAVSEVSAGVGGVGAVLGGFRLALDDRLDRHRQGVVVRRDLDLGARRHPRAQRFVGSVEQDLGLEEGHVGLGRFGVARAADLDHLAGVLAVGDRVHLQDHPLTLCEVHDLGLVDVDLGQDLRQVGDRADDRGRVVHRARDHHLTDLGVQGDHPAGDRRVDRRLAQIVLRLDEHRPGLE